MSEPFESAEPTKEANPRGGPRTAEGKARSRFNAVRHGLTSQTSILPWEEHAGYEKLSSRMIEQFKPVGPMEEFLVESIVDGIWKLNRGNATEAGLFALYLRGHEGILTEGDPQVDMTLMRGLMYTEQSQKLVNLWRHARNVENRIHQAQERLEAMQAKRKQQEEEALLEAAVLKNEHEKRPENKRMPYNPAEDGFVLTLQQIDNWMRRQERRQKARLSVRKLPAEPKMSGKERIAA